jgi:hypothetical protein
MLFVSPFCQNQCLASLQQIRCSQCVHPGNSAKYKSNKEKTKLEIKCYLEVKGKHAVLFEHENTNTECDIICVYLRLSHTSYFLYTLNTFKIYTQKTKG